MTQPQLHYYRCSFCKGTLITSVRDKNRPCRTCLRLMRYEFSVPVKTEKERALYEAIETYNGGEAANVPLMWACVRCGKATDQERPKYRVDGRCCQACVEAEVRPKRQLLTEDEIKRVRAQREAAIHEDYDRMEAAYRAAETKR